MSQESEGQSKIVKPLRGGQMTIPAEFREALGIDQDTLLKVTLEGGEMRVKPLRVSEQTGDASWLKELYDLFAPVREDMSKYSEEEVDQAIQEALSAVRRKRRG